MTGHSYNFSRLTWESRPLKLGLKWREIGIKWPSNPGFKMKAGFNTRIETQFHNETGLQNSDSRSMMEI